MVKMAKNRTSHALDSRWWLILGASSPISRAFARAVVARGASVILCGRKVPELEAIAADLRLRAPMVRVVTQQFEATDAESRLVLVKACRRLVPSHCLDVFLGFAYYEQQQAIETSPMLGEKVITVSFTAAALTLMELLPILDQGTLDQGALDQGTAANTKPPVVARVIIVASVAGDRGRASNFVYGAAKAGLIAFASGYRARLAASGVAVLTAKPGFLDTHSTWGMPRIFLAASPNAAANALLKASLAGRNQLYFPWFWKWIMLIIKLIPEGIFKNLKL